MNGTVTQHYSVFVRLLSLHVLYTTVLPAAMSQTRTVTTPREFELGFFWLVKKRYVFRLIQITNSPHDLDVFGFVQRDLKHKHERTRHRSHCTFHSCQPCITSSWRAACDLSRG